MNIQDKVNIMQAFIDGAQIEYRRVFSTWTEVSDPKFNWHTCDYRVKEVEMWINVWASGTRGITIYRSAESAKDCSDSNSIQRRVYFNEDK